MESPFKNYLIIVAIIVTTSILMGGFGFYFNIKILLDLHPYIFFIGFGNLSILILNRYLSSILYKKLESAIKEQNIFIFGVLLSIILVIVSYILSIGFIKFISGLTLFILTGYQIFVTIKKITLKGIWKDLALRYYIFDLIFLNNGSMGLGALGLKEQFPNCKFIPFFITESAYFLGSSFPLSISVMGFIYVYILKKRGKFITIFFEFWFHFFIGGVLIFLLSILVKNYFGMYLSSNILIFGVVIILFLMIFFNKKVYKNPPILYFSIALFFLIISGIFGVLNIYFMGVNSFGDTPPLSEKYMWNYHIHTHLALLGWILLSFFGIIIAIYRSFAQKGDLKENFIETNIYTKGEKKTIFLIALTISISLILLTISFYFEIVLISLISSIFIAFGYLFLILYFLKRV